jgi:hypothetical protein
MFPKINGFAMKFSNVGNYGSLFGRRVKTGVRGWGGSRNLYFADDLKIKNRVNDPVSICKS